MGIGDVPLPVASNVEPNNPVPATGDDPVNKVGDRVTVLERAGNTELVRQVRWLYDFLGQTYPPP